MTLAELIQVAKSKLVECGRCDYGLLMDCVCPEQYDPRWIISGLLEQIEGIERAVRERVAQDIETELAAVAQAAADQRTRSPRQELAYRTAAHIARGGACIANPKGVTKP